MAYLLKVAGPIAFCLAGLGSEAHATVLTATGTFSNGSVLTGTVTIDPGIGVITASDLIISGVGEFANIVSQFNFGPPVYYSAVINDTTQTDQLSLGLLADSLIGYTGGDLCSENTGACFASVYYPISNPIDEVTLVSGILHGGSAAVPEPSSLCLSFSALAICFLLLKYRIPRAI